MKNGGFVQYLGFVVIIFLLVAINTDRVMSKENAVKLLEPAWEKVDTNINKEMVLYYIDIEELDLELGRELEFRLSLKQDAKKEKAWLIIIDELAEIDWADFSYKAKNYNMFSRENTVYHSWILTVPEKKAEINLNTTLITDEDTDTLNYLKIIINPLQIFEREIYSYLTLEYKNSFGTVSRLETGLWSSKRSERPAVLLKQRIVQGKKEEYKYFALYLNSQYMEGNFLNQSGEIMVINNINGINNLLNLEKLYKSPMEWGAYISGRGGGIEFIRESGGNTIDSSIFISSGKVDYHLCFSKSILKESGLSGIISVNNYYLDNTGPYLMCGISDRLDYFNGLSCQLIYYPAIVSCDDIVKPLSAAELRIEYEKEPFELRYRTIYLEGEYENRLKLNYSISPTMAFSTIWEGRDHEENYYLGIIFKK